MERAIQRLWIVITLVGAGIGICLAMLYRQDPVDRARVRLDDSLPFFFGGLLVGAVVGCGVAVACRRWPETIRGATVATVAILGTVIGGPIGWIYGDMKADRRPDVGMAIGAVLGGVLFLMLALIQARLDRKRPEGLEPPTD